MRVSFILFVSLAVLGSSMGQPQPQQPGARPQPVRPAGNSIRDSRLGNMFSTISSRFQDAMNTITAGISRAMNRTNRRSRVKPTLKQQQALAASEQRQVYTEREDEVAPNAPNVARPQRPRQNTFRQMIDRAMGGIMNLFRRSTRRVRQQRSAPIENVQSE